MIRVGRATPACVHESRQNQIILAQNQKPCTYPFGRPAVEDRRTLLLQVESKSNTGNWLVKDSDKVLTISEGNKLKYKKKTPSSKTQDITRKVSHFNYTIIIFGSLFYAIGSRKVVLSVFYTHIKYEAN